MQKHANAIKNQQTQETLFSPLRYLTSPATNIQSILLFAVGSCLLINQRLKREYLCLQSVF